MTQESNANKVELRSVSSSIISSTHRPKPACGSLSKPLYNAQTHTRTLPYATIREKKKGKAKPIRTKRR